MAKQRRSFSIEFKREAASLVVDQGYFVAEAARAVDVGAVHCGAGLSCFERNGMVCPRRTKASTTEQHKVQELEARISR